MIDHLAARGTGWSDSGICHTETVKEMQTYVIEDNGATNAQEGCFDDRVMSYGIAQQMVIALPRIKVTVPPKTFKAVGKAGY